MVVAVQIKLFANLRELVKQDRLILEFEKPPSMKELLDSVREKFPELGCLLFKGDRFDERYRIVSDRKAVDLQSLSTEPAGNSIAILPPVSGG